ncbi:hypothetical protein BROUX41_002527 [Berkeleyomyces rouxiae]
MPSRKPKTMRKPPAAKRKPRSRVVKKAPIVLQQAYDLGSKGATGLWLGTSEPNGYYSLGAMENWSIEKFEKEKTTSVPYQDLGGVGAMQKGDLVFWFQRSLDGFTGLLEVVQNNDADPTTRVDHKSVKKKFAFALRTKYIKPGILRCHLQWRATFSKPITSFDINMTSLLNNVIAHDVVLNSTVISKSQYEEDMTKKREARKKWKKPNLLSYDKRHVKFLVKEEGYTPENDLDRYADYDCIDSGVSTVDNQDGTMTITIKKIVNQCSPLALWWWTRKPHAVLALSYNEADVLLELCKIKSMHPSLWPWGLDPASPNEILRKKARNIRGGAQPGAEMAQVTHIGMI